MMTLIDTPSPPPIPGLPTHPPTLPFGEGGRVLIAQEGMMPNADAPRSALGTVLQPRLLHAETVNSSGQRRAFICTFPFIFV